MTVVVIHTFTELRTVLVSRDVRRVFRVAGFVTDETGMDCTVYPDGTVCCRSDWRAHQTDINIKNTLLQ